MKLQMLASNTFEVWTLSFFVVIGAGLLLFGKKGEMVFVGVVALIGATVIAHSNHTQYIGERFLMEEFNSGSALSCGMWRGEGVKVDPKNGWMMEEGVGFVKGDVIINDPGVCSVIGKPFPEPSAVPYWFALVSVIGVLSMLRYALMRHEPKASGASAEEKNDEDQKP